MLLKILTIAALVFICYEDFRYRLVRLGFYIALLVLVVIQRLEQLEISDLLYYGLLNLAYVSLLLGSCAIVFFFRRKNNFKMSGLIGSGDILFLLSLMIWFDPVWLIVFNASSLFIALALHFVLNPFSFYNRENTVPLAGMQSLCFLPVFIYTSTLL